MKNAKDRDVAAIDVLLRELNVFSFLAFTNAYVFLPLSVAFALWGITTFLLWYSVPWMISAVVYLYWRMKHFRARCKRYSQAGQAREYWKALKWDSLRIIVIGGLALSTLGPFLVKGASISLYVSTFIGGALVFSLLVMFAYITYWGAARSSV